MNKKQRKTLEAIFKKPSQAGIKWLDVETLIIALGGEIEKGRSGSRVGIYLQGKKRKGARQERTFIHFNPLHPS